MTAETAETLVCEARSLLNAPRGEQTHKQIEARSLELALKALRDEEISEDHLDKLHAAVAHKLRDQGHPGR